MVIIAARQVFIPASNRFVYARAVVGLVIDAMTPAEFLIVEFEEFGEHAAVIHMMTVDDEAVA